MITPRKLKELVLALEHDASDSLVWVFVIDGKTIRLTDPSVAQHLEKVAKKLNDLYAENDQLSDWGSMPTLRCAEFED